MKLSRLRRFILEASWDKSFGAEILSSSGVKNWLAQFGINNPKFVGEGGLGYAYRDGNKVVKLTSDKNEAEVATKLINKPAHKNLIRIYGVEQYGKQTTNKLGLKRNIYLIVQDAVNTKIDHDLAVAADNVGGCLDHYGERPPWTSVEFDEMFKQCLNNDPLSPIDPLSPVAKRMRELLMIVQSVYETTGLNYVDVARGNTGLDAKGNIKLFDYGLSEI